MADEPASSESVSEAELLSALAQMQVADLLVQSLSTISSLGYHRLAGEGRDLDQARLAIESLRALVPVLRGAVPDELVRDFEQVTTNLQLAYASAVSEAGAAPTSEGHDPSL